MQNILNKIVPSIALLLLATQAACFSAPAYRPDNNSVVSVDDSNALSEGMTTADSNNIVQAANVAFATLSTDSNAAPPASTPKLLADANAMASVDSNDFAALTQAFGVLFNDNAAAYYITLQQVVDRGLRGSLHYALMDTLNYHPATLRVNGGTPATENAQFATYWQATSTAGDAQMYSAWAVPAELNVAPALTMEAKDKLPSVASLIPQMSNHDAIVASLTAAAPATAHGVDGPAFAQVVIALVPIYQTALVKYYQVLAQVPDPLLRDVIDFTITDAVANHPTVLTASDGGAATLSADSWPYYGKVGFAGDPNVTTSTGAVLMVAGPLQGKPYPTME